MKENFPLFTEDIEKQVVNVILDLASPTSQDDYRTEAVAVSFSFNVWLILKFSLGRREGCFLPQIFHFVSLQELAWSTMMANKEILLV